MTEGTKKGPAYIAKALDLHRECRNPEEDCCGDLAAIGLLKRLGYPVRNWGRTWPLGFRPRRWLKGNAGDKELRPL